MCKQVIQKTTIVFDLIQFRGFKAIVGTEIPNFRLPEAQVADRGLILYHCYIKNNSDHLQFISDSFKLVIPKLVILGSVPS
jgi:hypothetical protein